MARLAVFASGNGGNFEALVLALKAGRPYRGDAPNHKTFFHECVLLVHDRKSAYAAERASRLGIPARYISYVDRSREAAELDIEAALDEAGAQLVALAGYMRLLGPGLVRAWEGRILNIHPSLLPRWPGKDAIRRAYEAGEGLFGVTVHYVDEDMDAGPTICQEVIARAPGETLDDVEKKIHSVEHRLYPKVVFDSLDRIEERMAQG